MKHPLIQTGLQNSTPWRMHRITETVSIFYGVGVMAMRYDRSHRHAIAHPRQVAMYLIRTRTDATQWGIADWFSRDHSTVLHGINQVAGRIASSPSARAEVEFLAKELDKLGIPQVRAIVAPDLADNVSVIEQKIPLQTEGVKVF